jgi:hypothetical protein
VVYETEDLIDKALIEGFGCANEPYEPLHDRRDRRVDAGLRVRLFMSVRDGFHPGVTGIVGLDVDDGRPQIFKEPFIPLFLRFKPGDKPTCASEEAYRKERVKSSKGVKKNTRGPSALLPFGQTMAYGRKRLKICYA